MSENQPDENRDEQQPASEPEPPADDDRREQLDELPPDVLSLDFSEYSDDELAEIYESSRTTGSVTELEQARQRSIRGFTDHEFACRYNRARGGPVRPEEVNIVARTASENAPPTITDYEVKRVILEEFGEEGWTVMKPLLATHATLLLDDIESSRAMMVEGQSGVGKTMLLKTFGGLDEQFCRRSDITPASFVSAGASSSEEDAENTDLLPLLEGRTLAVRDAQTLFAGSEQSVESTWRTIARIMDGDGYFRQTATGGKAGYDDIRFNFIGATTPLTPRAWRMMGNVGQRLLFVEWPEEEYEDGWLSSVVDGGERRPIDRGQVVVQEFLDDLWERHGGSSSVAWSDERPDDVMEVIEYLAKIVTFARASITSGEPQREAPKRIGQLLHDLARGHALIHGRTYLTMSDLTVCARVALSTMPSKRRPLVRALLNPEIDEPLTSRDVENNLGVTRPTARDRIEEVTSLGIGEAEKVKEQGGMTKAVRVTSEFRWPDDVAFPEF